MANRVFQSVIYQMKDAIDRVVGVVDETGAVISCSELNLIGEVREGFMAERLTAGDRFVRDGYTYQQFSSAKHNDYAVFLEPLFLFCASRRGEIVVFNNFAALHYLFYTKEFTFATYFTKIFLTFLVKLSFGGIFRPKKHCFAWFL